MHVQHIAARTLWTDPLADIGNNRKHERKRFQEHSPDTRQSSSWSSLAVPIRPPPQVPEGQQPILQQGQHHSWQCYTQEHSKRSPWWIGKIGKKSSNMSVIVARHAEREDCAWFMKGDNWQAQAGRPWDTPLTLVGHRQGQALG